MKKTVTLLDGYVLELQYDGDVVCGICGEEYTFEVRYCDENIECAMDDGESLIVVGQKLFRNTACRVDKHKEV